MEKDRSEEIATAVTHAQTVAVSLENLRDGKTGMAMESLELSIDVSVITLSVLLKETAQQDREMIVTAFQLIRDYRRRHPRRSEYDMRHLDKKRLDRNCEIRQKAQKILDEVQ